MDSCASLRRRTRPGGRSARVRAAVLTATAELLVEGGYDLVDVREVARRAGVHPTTIYRRWATKARLVGEALLERSQTLSPTPDTGSLEDDMRRLLRDGAALAGTPAVKALFQVLMAGVPDAAGEVAAARDRFWDAHLVEAGGIVDRAVARSELPATTNPAALIDLVVGPALLRLVFMGQELGEREIEEIIDRAIASLRSPRGSIPSATARTRLSRNRPVHET